MRQAPQHSYEVKVKGSTGNTYTVACDSKGRWSCTCKAYVYAKGRKWCKHIEGVVEDLLEDTQASN